ncbi:MAG: triose-phosphate isomerase [Caulobacterales bacterium]
MVRPLIAGNWKMHGASAALAEAKALAESFGGKAPQGADVALCAPATLVERLARTLNGTNIWTGGQDCHPEVQGAFTGDIAAEMLKDAGAACVIVGHSERRQYHGETDAQVAQKALAAIRAGLFVIICVGESEAQRDAGQALSIVTAQTLASLPDLPDGSFAIAYEPIWAIGTGKVPVNADIVEMHGALRQALRGRLGAAADGVRLLYGGSVKGGNAAEILKLEGVNGALVGGASLKAAEFATIIKAAL